MKPEADMLLRRGLCLLGTLTGLLLTAGLLALAEVAQAAPPTAPTIAVTTTRNYPGAAPCHTSLQTCINGSANGDQINIAAGVFTQSFTLSKAVSLVGAGINLTVLRAQPNDRVFTITNSLTPSILISGVTIAGGAAPSTGGGGVIIGVGNQVTFDHVAFRENTAAGFGGGLRSSSPVTLVHSLFLSNTAGSGGGLEATLTQAVISDTQFIANSAVWEGSFVGGAGASLGTGVISDSRFERNFGPGAAGGGLTMLDGSVSNSEFVLNTALYGGGLSVYGTAAIQNVTFEGNVAEYLGGGAYLRGVAIFTNVTVVNNRAGDGGGLFFSNSSRQAWISGSVLSGNVATTTAGTSSVVFGYVRAATTTLDGLVNTTLTGPGTPASRAVQAGLGGPPALTGTTIISHEVGVVALGALAPISNALVIESWPVDCPLVVTYTRPITVWYGATTAGGVPVLEMTSASQLFSDGAWTAVAAAGRPAAVLRGLHPWIAPFVTNLELVVTSFPAFDAEAHLRTALAAAWRPAPYTGVRFDPPVEQGTDSYALDSFITNSTCDGNPLATTNVFQLRVTYVELNAVAVRQLFLPFVRR